MDTFTVTWDKTILEEKDGRYYVTAIKNGKELQIEVDNDAWRMFNEMYPTSEVTPG